MSVCVCMQRVLLLPTHLWSKTGGPVNPNSTRDQTLASNQPFGLTQPAVDKVFKGGARLRGALLPSGCDIVSKISRALPSRAWRGPSWAWRRPSEDAAGARVYQRRICLKVRLGKKFRFTSRSYKPMGITMYTCENKLFFIYRYS